MGDVCSPIPSASFSQRRRVRRISRILLRELTPHRTSRERVGYGRSHGVLSPPSVSLFGCRQAIARIVKRCRCRAVDACRRRQAAREDNSPCAPEPRSSDARTITPPWSACLDLTCRSSQTPFPSRAVLAQPPPSPPERGTPASQGFPSWTGSSDLSGFSVGGGGLDREALRTADWTNELVLEGPRRAPPTPLR